MNVEPPGQRYLGKYNKFSSAVIDLNSKSVLQNSDSRISALTADGTGLIEDSGHYFELENGVYTPKPDNNVPEIYGGRLMNLQFLGETDTLLITKQGNIQLYDISEKRLIHNHDFFGFSDRYYSAGGYNLNQFNKYDNRMTRMVRLSGQPSSVRMLDIFTGKSKRFTLENGPMVYAVGKALFIKGNSPLWFIQPNEIILE